MTRFIPAIEIAQPVTNTRYMKENRHVHTDFVAGDWDRLFGGSRPGTHSHANIFRLACQRGVSFEYGWLRCPSGVVGTGEPERLVGRRIRQDGSYMDVTTGAYPIPTSLVPLLISFGAYTRERFGIKRWILHYGPGETIDEDFQTIDALAAADMDGSMDVGGAMHEGLDGDPQRLQKVQFRSILQDVNNIMEPGSSKHDLRKPMPFQADTMALGDWWRYHGNEQGFGGRRIALFNNPNQPGGSDPWRQLDYAVELKRMGYDVCGPLNLWTNDQIDALSSAVV